MPATWVFLSRSGDETGGLAVLGGRAVHRRGSLGLRRKFYAARGGVVNSARCERSRNVGTHSLGCGRTGPEMSPRGEREMRYFGKGGGGGPGDTSGTPALAGGSPDISGTPVTRRAIRRSAATACWAAALGATSTSPSCVSASKGVPSLTRVPQPVVRFTNQGEARLLHDSD